MGVSCCTAAVKHQLIQVCACSAAILGAADDPWWPPAHHARAAALLPAHLLEFDEQQVHAFCVDSDLSARAAEFLHRVVSPALARAPSRL